MIANASRRNEARHRRRFTGRPFAPPKRARWLSAKKPRGTRIERKPWLAFVPFPKRPDVFEQRSLPSDQRLPVLFCPKEVVGMSSVFRPRQSPAAGLLSLLALLLVVAPLVADSRPDAGDAIIDSAQRARRENNSRAAAQNYRDFLSRFPGHKQAATAHFGLAQALVDGPDKDY